MPLPWKKHRISQLVADLQSPSKRRGSLVVETGFPTSLVDLFVKNRDRLRKSSSKKHGHKNKHAPRRGGIDSSDIPSTTSPPAEIPATTTIPLSNSSEGAPVLRRPNTVEFRGAEASGVAGGRRCDGMDSDEEIKRVDGNESFANRVFAAVLKTFVVVTLALSTKKLAVGITLSAFVLLLIEYVGKHMNIDVGVFLKPCSNASEGLLDLIQRGLLIFQPKKASRRLEKCNASKRLVLQESSVLCDSLDEIETVGDSNFEEEIGGGEESAGLSCVIVDRDRSCVDTREDRAEEALLYCKNQSRSRRIQSKIIKKFVPKKLWDLRKKKKSKGTELEEDEEESSEKSSYFSIEEQELEDGGEDNLDKLGGENNEDNDVKSQTPWSCEPARATLVEGSEKLGRVREGNSGYQMLILIVLGRLVGGRIWAFVLTVLWCLALKSLRNPLGFKNVELISSLVAVQR